MLFILAAELGEVEAWALDDLQAVEKIAHCAFDGSHIVAIETLQVCTKLLAAPVGTFGAVTQAVLRKLAADFSFQGWLFESGLATAMITTVGTVEQVRLRSPLVLSLSQVRDMSLGPTTLLAENLIDAKVFKVAAEHHVCASGLRGVVVSAATRGGGGSTIVPELEELVAGCDRVCLAITDSDQAWPTAGVSAASKKCEKLSQEAAAPIGFKSILVRELENLVPPSVLSDLDVQPHYIDAVRKFESICKQIPEIRVCGDIKDGIRGSRTFRLPEGSPEREFLSQLLKFNHGKDVRCCREEDCHRERNGAECDCMCVPRVGAIGEKFHSWLEERSARKALEAFSPPWREPWLDVGAVVLSWCCARPRMRG